ncbi:RNA polymerase Rpc34 [Dillenia turbinata]|uniref:RNA polymerase Rpc34 n=1 Tax=Dillenia turbinata TaxID=194707 RepID=A0AAN8YZA8_9MAGN
MGTLICSFFYSKSAKTTILRPQFALQTYARLCSNAAHPQHINRSIPEQVVPKRLRTSKTKENSASGRQFEPSKELTGGDWYADGNIDTEFTTEPKEVCFRQINVIRVATIDNIAEEIRRPKGSKQPEVAMDPHSMWSLSRNK